MNFAYALAAQQAFQNENALFDKKMGKGILEAKMISVERHINGNSMA
ncbi:MAG: hypothetical protein LBC94_06690 [Desulfovibrio sp.]|nr:hypothetical protein [Desulfovibrio sp.]